MPMSVTLADFINNLSADPRQLVAGQQVENAMRAQHRLQHGLANDVYPDILRRFREPEELTALDIDDPNLEGFRAGLRERRVLRG